MQHAHASVAPGHFITRARPAADVPVHSSDDDEEPDAMMIIEEGNEIYVNAVELAEDDVDDIVPDMTPLLCNRHVALLAADGVDVNDVATLKEGLEAEGAQVSIVAPEAGMIAASGGVPLLAPYALGDVSADMFDAVCVPGGEDSVQVLERSASALAILVETYRHRKSIALLGEATPLLEFILFCSSSSDLDSEPGPGMVLAKEADTEGVMPELIDAIRTHRHWSRPVACVFG
ncbi:MAG: DJ-1/PfpI family protein [Rhodocyclaceae bacterium]